MSGYGRIQVFALSLLGGDAIKVPLRTIVKDYRLVWLSTALKAAAFICAWFAIRFRALWCIDT